jgi:hypothetical protein
MYNKITKYCFSLQTNKQTNNLPVLLRARFRLQRQKDVTDGLHVSPPPIGVADVVS